MLRTRSLAECAVSFGLSLLLAASVAKAQQVAVEELTLPNGMQFLLVPRSDQPNVVSAGWVAKVGSVDERPGITGISHFFEHMMFKGTGTIGTRDPKQDAKYRAEQKTIRDEINRLVWTGQYQRFNRGEIADPWDPANDTQELRLLRGKLDALIRAQQGRGEGGADAATIVKDEFDQVYTKAGGSGMNAFTSHDLTCYFITVPANKLELWAWMESDRLHDSVFREFYSERDVVHEERRLRTDSTPTGRFQEQFDAMFWSSCGYAWPVIGWPSDLNSYTFDQAQEYWNTYYRPGNLVGIVVGDFDPAKAKAMITKYFSRLDPDTRKHAGLFVFEAETRGEATPDVLENAWYEELKKLQQQELPERELRKVKNRVAAGNYRRLENNMSLLIQLAFADALLDWQEINDGPKKYEAVTAADIRRVAKKYFSQTNRSVAVFQRAAQAQAEQ